jgi:tetratricopeptide (TPR) repeat protein
LPIILEGLPLTQPLAADALTGERIRRRRRELSLTQAQLAGPRYSKSYISLIESGHAKPSPQALEYIAARLDKPVQFFRGDHSRQASDLRSLLAAAQAFIRRRDFAAAEERLRLAATLAMSLDDQLHLARVHENAGHLFVATGDLPSARLALREAIRAYNASGAVDAAAAARCSLANVLLLGGDLAAARTEIQAAQDAYAGVDPNHLVLGRSYLLGGNIASAAGCHEAARRCFEQALSLMAGRDMLGLGETHAALGLHALGRGEWEQARACLQRAMGFLEGVSDSHCLSILTRHLSDACFRCGDLEQAADMARRSGSLSSSLGDRYGVIWAAASLAEIALPAGDLTMAREAAGEARRLLQAARQAVDMEDGLHRLLTGRVCRVAARISTHDGAVEVAASYLREAIDVLSGWRPGLGMLIAASRELASHLRALGRCDDAIRCYEDALSAAQGAQTTEVAGPDPILQLSRMPSPLWFRS